MGARRRARRCWCCTWRASSAIRMVRTFSVPSRLPSFGNGKADGGCGAAGSVERRETLLDCPRKGLRLGEGSYELFGVVDHLGGEGSPQPSGAQGGQSESASSRPGKQSNAFRRRAERSGLCVQERGTLWRVCGARGRRVAGLSGCASTTRACVAAAMRARSRPTTTSCSSRARGQQARAAATSSDEMPRDGGRCPFNRDLLLLTTRTWHTRMPALAGLCSLGQRQGAADGHRAAVAHVGRPAQRPLQPTHRPAVQVCHAGADHDALPLAVDPHRQGGRVAVEQHALRHTAAA